MTSWQHCTLLLPYSAARTWSDEILFIRGSVKYSRPKLIYNFSVSSFALQGSKHKLSFCQGMAVNQNDILPGSEIQNVSSISLECDLKLEPVATQVCPRPKEFWKQGKREYLTPQHFLIKDISTTSDAGGGTFYSKTVRDKIEAPRHPTFNFENLHSVPSCGITNLSTYLNLSTETESKNVWEYLKQQDEKIKLMQNQISVVLKKKPFQPSILETDELCASKNDTLSSKHYSGEVQFSNNQYSESSEFQNNQCSETSLNHSFILSYLKEHSNRICRIENQLDLLLKRTETLKRTTPKSTDSKKQKHKSKKDPKSRRSPEILYHVQRNVNPEHNVSPSVLPSSQFRKKYSNSPGSLFDSDRENQVVNEVQSPQEKNQPLFDSIARNINQLISKTKDKDVLDLSCSGESHPKNLVGPSNAHHAILSQNQKKFKSPKAFLLSSSSSRSSDSEVDSEIFHHGGNHDSSMSRYMISSPNISFATQQYCERFGLVRGKSFPHNAESQRMSSKTSRIPGNRQLR